MEFKFFLHIVLWDMIMGMAETAAFPLGWSVAAMVGSVGGSVLHDDHNCYQI